MKVDPWPFCNMRPPFPPAGIGNSPPNKKGVARYVKGNPTQNGRTIQVKDLE